MHKIVDDLSDRIIKNAICDNDGPNESQKTGYLFNAGKGGVMNFINDAPGKNKRRYRSALDQILAKGFTPLKHSRMSVFVKRESFYKEGKAPRLIMGRDPRFALFYNTVIEPFDKPFFNLPQCTYNDNYDSLGHKFGELVGQWFCENDFSQCESSIQPFWLDLQLRCMNKVLTAIKQQANLKMAWAMKIVKDGQWREYITFKFQECTGSGDRDTSSLNGFVNWVSSRYFLIKNIEPNCKVSSDCAGCSTDKFLLKGDDNVMRWPRGVTEFKNTYTLFGLDAKLIIRKTPEEVEFCSGHFIETTPGNYLYVQKLVKLIDSLQRCLNSDALKRGWVAQYYKSLGLMYKVLYRDIPVYSEIAEFLLNTNFDGGINANLINSWNLTNSFKQSDGCVRRVDQSLCELSVAMANGLSIPEVERIKDWFSTNALHFPASMTKRCNLRACKTTPKVTEVEQEIFNSCFANAWDTLTKDKRFAKIKQRYNRVLKG